MSQIITKFADDVGESKAKWAAAIEEEVVSFSKFMGNLQDPMARGELEDFEMALVRSYLIAKLTGKLDGGK